MCCGVRWIYQVGGIKDMLLLITIHTCKYLPLFFSRSKYILLNEYVLWARILFSVSIPREHHPHSLLWLGKKSEPFSELCLFYKCLCFSSVFPATGANSALSQVSPLSPELSGAQTHSVVTCLFKQTFLFLTFLQPSTKILFFRCMKQHHVGLWAEGCSLCIQPCEKTPSSRVQQSRFMNRIFLSRWQTPDGQGLAHLVTGENRVWDSVVDAWQWKSGISYARSLAGFGVIGNTNLYIVT